MSVGHRSGPYPILALWSRVGWETIYWSEGSASWCDKESRKHIRQ